MPDAPVQSSPPMHPSTHTVLVETVSLYEEADEPVSKERLAQCLDVPKSTLAEPLDSLSECDLLAPTGDGYRPTVTAHDLLELDVEFDDALVVDVVDE